MHLLKPHHDIEEAKNESAVLHRILDFSSRLVASIEF